MVGRTDYFENSDDGLVCSIKGEPRSVLVRNKKNASTNAAEVVCGLVNLEDEEDDDAAIVAGVAGTLHEVQGEAGLGDGGTMIQCTNE